MIFNYATAPTPPDRTTRNFHRVVLLTHVYHQWRNILLSYAPIWSNIYIHGQHLDRLKTQIKRCRQVSLSVFIEVPSRNGMEFSRHLELTNNIWVATNLIRERRNQVIHLRARMGCLTFQRHLRCEWPKLKALDFIDTCSQDSEFHQNGNKDPTQSNLSRLETLSIYGRYNWPVKVATNLTTLKLMGFMELELTTLTEFFRRNTTLESLELANMTVRESPSYHREEPIELPHLVKLSVRGATCGSALALLNLSSVKHLWVSLGERVPWSDSLWPEICSRLLITSLEAEYSTSNTITVAGSRGPDTHILRLVETNKSPPILGTALFKLLSNASLSSVTSLHLVKNATEKGMSPQLIAAICNLLKHLPQVEHVRLCPSTLAVAGMTQLSGNPRLCPELRRLEVVVTEKTCKLILGFLTQLVEARAGGGDRSRIQNVTGLYPADPELLRREKVGIRVVWKKHRMEAGLEEYMSGELCTS